MNAPSRNVTFLVCELVKTRKTVPRKEVPKKAGMRMRKMRKRMRRKMLNFFLGVPWGHLSTPDRPGLEAPRTQASEGLEAPCPSSHPPGLESCAWGGWATTPGNMEAHRHVLTLALLYSSPN